MRGTRLMWIGAVAIVVGGGPSQHRCHGMPLPSSGRISPRVPALGLCRHPPTDLPRDQTPDARGLSRCPAGEIRPGLCEKPCLAPAQ